MVDLTPSTNPEFPETAPSEVPSARGTPARALIDGQKPSVFISYSRDDLLFADQLVAGLELCGYEVSIDRHGISGGEAWQRRLEGLIQGADTIVFILSSASVQSRTCSWEVERATLLRKRIIPVVCKPLSASAVPKQLQDLNFIFFYDEAKVPGSGFGTGLRNLVLALQTDLDWLREHTRLLQRATEWDAGGRPANRLLSGSDVAEAKEWAAARPKGAPELTSLHYDFLHASEVEELARQDSQGRQNEIVRVAQMEREEALRQAEAALKKSQEELRKRARLRNIMFGSVSLLAAVAIWFAFAADRQQRAMSNVLGRAGSIIASVQYQIDDDTKKDFVEVFKRGAALGNAKSMVHLGLFYLDGDGVPKDATKARELFLNAAAKGDGEAMYILGGLYAEGEGGVQKDLKAAAAWYDKAASAGNPEAVTMLGRIYAEGRGVPADPARARQLFEYAAQGGSAGAMIEMAKLSLSGAGGPKNSASAREWYEKAVASGDPDAIVEAGVAYADGTLGAKNDARALQLFQQAAAKGNPAGMTEAGIAFLLGTGVAKDPIKARQWFEFAAAKGEIGAMYELGNLYANGEGVKRDYDKARQYYEKASQGGNADATFELGVVYANGEGVTKDLDKARALYERAAADGNAAAMRELAKMYETGTGVSKDLQQARNWVSKAEVIENGTGTVASPPTKSKQSPTRVKSSVVRSATQNAVQKK